MKRTGFLAMLAAAPIAAPLTAKVAPTDPAVLIERILNREWERVGPAILRAHGIMPWKQVVGSIVIETGEFVPMFTVRRKDGAL